MFRSTVAHFFELFAVFVLGGLFSSTAVAAVTAATAIGKENFRQLWDIFKLIVGHVWGAFKMLGLGEARCALGKWKWKEGWKVLRASLLESLEMPSRQRPTFTLLP